MDIQALQKQRADLIEQASAIETAARDENRDLTVEQNDQIDALISEVDELEGQIEAAQASEARSARLASARASLTTATGRRTAPAEPSADVQVGADRREADPTLGWDNLGEFAAAVQTACVPGARADERLLIGAAASGMSQGSGSDGGFMVPPQFSDQIWDGLNDPADSLLPRTDSYPVEGESLEFPANAETSRATGSRYGGVRGYWLSEAEQITSSNPKLRKVRLEPQELAVLVYVTDKLLRNGGRALSTYVERSARDEINFLLGDAIIDGSGAGKPLGIIRSDATVVVAKEAGQAADTIKTENIDNMWARMHAKARANAVWFINQDCEPQLQQLSQDVGTGGIPVYRPQGGIANAPHATLYGRPIVPIEYCKTVGDKGDIVLADMRAYATGLQGNGINEATSMHLRFDYAETAFRFMFAADGRPWLAAPITPFNGSNTLSPFVVLAERA